jgi:uncharacterized protein (TIGR03067 family)
VSRFLVLVLAVAASLSPTRAAPKTKNRPVPPEGLIGRWVAEAATTEGKPFEPSDQALRFAADWTFELRSEGKVIRRGTYAVDTTKDPPEIDFEDAPGAVRLAIFKLDGDRLTIAGTLARTRPKSFEPDPAARLTQTVYRREPTKE